MDRLKKIIDIRSRLRGGGLSIGSWMQIPHPSVAEIMGSAGYDWVAVDLEHGSISSSQLPDIFRALELNDTLPLARIAEGLPKDCKQALDAGAGGLIVPMIESADQLEAVKNACRWPPAGARGVGFSRANLYGKNFDVYREEAQKPLLVAMIENVCAVRNLEEILAVEGLDAVLIGPYDLSASMGMVAQFDHEEYVAVVDQIKVACNHKVIPVGIHIVQPSIVDLQNSIRFGYRFIAYAIDSVFMNSVCSLPTSIDLDCSGRGE